VREKAKPGAPERNWREVLSQARVEPARGRKQELITLARRLLQDESIRLAALGPRHAQQEEIDEALRETFLLEEEIQGKDGGPNSG
jgi:hypothetical protein